MTGLVIFRWLTRMVTTFLGVSLLTAATVGMLVGLAYIALHDPHSESMIVLLYVIIVAWGVPIFYLMWSVVALVRAPEGMRWPALAGVVVPVAVIWSAAAVGSIIDSRSVNTAAAVIETHQATMPGPGSGETAGGHASSTYVCDETAMAWTISNSVNHDEAYAWIVAAESQLVDGGWEVITRHQVQDHSAPRPDEESVVVVGVAGEEAISFRADFFVNGDQHNGYRAKARTSTNAYVGKCVAELGAADIPGGEFPLAPIPSATPNIFD